MRAIQKGAEPVSLAQYRAGRTADYVPTYDGYRKLDDLRQSLVAEQGALCCYCMQRVRPTAQGMRVEHWHCQTVYQDEQLDYANLLGACLGGKGKPPNLQHCDVRKGDQDLSRNPANPSHRIESFISFLADGTIESADAALNDELNVVLNLNLPMLKRNRKAALDRFKQSLAGRGSLSKAQWERECAQWSSIGQDARLQEYCQVVVYWIKKRIARA